MAHTYSYLPTNIPQVISDIVEQVSINLYSELGSTVQFKHGTWKSIKERILEENGSRTRKNVRFPLVCLIQVFEEDFKADSEYSEATLTLLICNESEPQWYSEERYTNNYLPTLYPIYAEFMELLNASPYVVGYNQRYFQHTKADDLHLPETDVNKLPECLDGLWVRDLKIAIDNRCAAPEYVINTELVFTSAVNQPGIPTGTDTYDFTVEFSDTNGLKDGTTFVISLVPQAGTLAVATADTNLTLSQVGTNTTVTIADRNAVTGPLVFTAVGTTPPSTVGATGGVTSVTGLRNNWINRTNTTDTITI